MYQLHRNDEPKEQFEVRDFHEIQYYVLKQWDSDWRTAEVWQNGICVMRFMRLPMVAYQFVVVSWSDSGRAFVNVYDTDGQIAPAFQSGELRLV